MAVRLGLLHDIQIFFFSHDSRFFSNFSALAFEESQRRQLESELEMRDEVAPLPANTPNDFRLEDFVQPVPPSTHGRVVRSAIKDAVLSRHNYKRLTKLFADEAFRTDQEHIHQIYFSGTLKCVRFALKC